MNIKKFISGYSKQPGKPPVQFNWRVSNKGHFKQICKLMGSNGAIVTAAWYNVYDRGVRVISERLK